MNETKGRIVPNNKVVLTGEVISDFSYNHEIFGEGFYMFDLLIKRISEIEDVIPIMVSDRLINVNKDLTGEIVTINGQFRSFNKHYPDRSRLVLSVFARQIDIIEDAEVDIATNSIYLEGHICKPPIYRKTPLGREIADILLAVNRPYGKSDYIPCICWGRNARFAGSLEVGTTCGIYGRIQSRDYMKKLEDGNMEKRVAYEVSAGKIKVVEDERISTESDE